MAKNILLVDDDEEVLELLSKKFMESGFFVITAIRGEEAVEKARTHQPHLIVMDIMLPDFSGPEAVKLLKDDPATRSLPVIFISGIVSKDEQDPNAGVRVDGVRYVAMAKPFSFQELLKEIRKTLGEADAAIPLS